MVAAGAIIFLIGLITSVVEPFFRRPCIWNYLIILLMILMGVNTTLLSNLPDCLVVLAREHSNTPLDPNTISALLRYANDAAAPDMFWQFTMTGLLGGAASIAIGNRQGPKRKRKGEQ